MKNKLQELKKELEGPSTLKGKLSVLKNACEGETAYILTCGPSFGRLDPAFLRERLRHELVLAVKQTYDVAGAITDFHLLNAWNYQAYAYAQPEPIVVFENHKTWPETPGLRPDLEFEVYWGHEATFQDELDRRLCVSRRFDEYLFEKRLERPWGPGIMYELGFYLALHLGVNKIVAVGWDIGTPNSKNMPHFYREAQNLELSRARHFVRDGKLYDLDATGCFVPSAASSDPVRLMNIPGFTEDEVMQISRSTETLYRWLQKRQVALEVVSDCSMAASCIPRVHL